jgi:hypothetical protein
MKARCSPAPARYIHHLPLICRVWADLPFWHPDVDIYYFQINIKYIIPGDFVILLMVCSFNGFGNSGRLNY